MARERRRSRVLEYFEQRNQNDPESSDIEEPKVGGDENPFQGFDSAFGLDLPVSGGDQ